MPVTYIEIENFKSYMGSQTVGPFRDFTSIIGPNGSGKSNLMDAIAFVLAVQARDLRSQQMKDLIFRPPGVSAGKQTLSAKVILYFNDVENDQEITFSRAISPSGVGDYLVDGSSVTAAKYIDRLAEIGVLVKAKNFLVFQGTVEKIARQTPKEMVAMLEEISSSKELAKDYDAALKAKDEAEAVVMEFYNQQRGIKSERRLLKEQKEEAERFQELLQKKADLQTELYLWQLYHIDSDIREQEDTLDDLKGDLEAKKATEEEYGESLKEAKKKASAARRKTQNLDKNRLEYASSVEKLEPELIEKTEQIKSLTKKISLAEGQLEKKKKQEVEDKDSLEELEEKIEERNKELATLEADYEEIKKAAVGNQVTLTEEQEEELERLQAETAAATAEPRRTLQALKRKLDTARSNAKQLGEELEEAKKTVKDDEKKMGEQKERKEKLAKNLEETTAQIKDLEKEKIEAEQAMQASQARRDEINEELEKINKTLRNAKESRRKTKEDERISQAIASLKRHFPGVEGRLLDLCRPTQRRFNLAITVAAGKDMDAIVVDTVETGKACIKHLKEERIGAFTFIPLDDMQVPSAESQERVRSVISNDSRFRLAADIISCDEAIKPAVLYAVGNTVVCDDLDGARDICFGGGSDGGGGDQMRLKAVTLGGAVISKAGSMTGGVTKGDDSKAGRWAAAELEKLVKRKDELETERLGLDTPAEAQDNAGRRRGASMGYSSKLTELTNNIGTYKSKQEFAKADLRYFDRQLRMLENNLKSQKRAQKKQQKNLEDEEKTIAKLDKEVKQAAETVKTAEEEHLMPFREKTGLQDFKAYEDAVGERRKAFTEQRRELKGEVQKLISKKDYFAKKDYKKQTSALQKRIADSTRKLETAKEDETKLKAQLEAARKELTFAEAEVKKALGSEKASDEEVQAAQAEYDEAQGERQKASKDVNAAESTLERLRGILHETLQKATLEEVELPLLEDSSESMDTEEGGSASHSQRSSRQTMTQDSSGMPHYSQGDNLKMQKDRKKASKVDYSKLDDHLKERPSDREEKRMKKDYEDQLNKVSAEIENASPNLKAAEALEIMTKKLKDTSPEFAKAKDDAIKAQDDFRKIKMQRTKIFNDAFNHIDESLKTIYTDMTKSSKHPLGGKAYLSLDDTEEPYKGGMKFNAMPPMKRFRDMEQLSGGEKTVAALSLLFAIHSYHPSPFFVMDEVDAALDNINLRKVCNYISQRSQTDFQCIVISLKDMFYERSQSLVGVCRDVGTSSSRTLTLDLTAFDKNDKKKDKRRGTKRKSNTNESETPKKSKSIQLDSPGFESAVGSTDDASPVAGEAASPGSPEE